MLQGGGGGSGLRGVLYRQGNQSRKRKHAEREGGREGGKRGKGPSGGPMAQARDLSSNGRSTPSTQQRAGASSYLGGGRGVRVHQAAPWHMHLSPAREECQQGRKPHAPAIPFLLSCKVSAPLTTCDS